MTGGIVRACALAVALAAGAQAGASTVVDAATVRRAVSTPAVAARDAELAALAARGRASDLAARLEATARDPLLDDTAREWLLDRGLHALARIEPSPAARASVARLALLAPTVFTRVDPGHRGRITPLYDAGATARFVLRRWDRTAATAIAQRELAAGSTVPVDRYAALAGQADDSALAGIADAFRAAPLRQIHTQRPAVAAAMAAGRRVDALALIVAERLADPELFDLVIDFAEAPTALAAVAAAPRALGSAGALGTLERASRRAGIASAAVLEAGRLAATDDTARRFLLQALDDPATAPSAAVALGRLADPAVSAELGRRLARSQDEAQRRLLVLALRLDGGDAARAALERFAQAGTGSPQLKAKVRQWLQR